jgi:alpha-L-fucosidase
MGEWMKVNSEAIYGTEASPLPTLPWGRCTMKTGNGRTTLYLSVFDWPKDGSLLVPGVKNAVVSAKLLAGGGKLKTRQSQQGITIRLPEKAPDQIASVIRLELKGTVPPAAE